MNKNTIFQENIADVLTGELTTKRWITKTQVKRQDFVLMYTQDMAKLKGLTNAEYRILIVLNKYIEYNTNAFYLNKLRREELANETGAKYNTVNQSISRLIKRNLLHKLSNNTYQMNPQLFFKGEEIERSKLLELTIQYQIEE